MTILHSILCGSLALTLTLNAFGQNPASPSNPSTPTSPTSPTRPGSSSPFPPTTQQQNPMPDFQRPIYLSGKVVLDDGTPPSDQVVVQLVCRGLPKPVAYVDSKGNFNADLNNRLNSALFADASSPYGANDVSGFGSTNPMSNNRSSGVGGGGGITERDLMGCDLQAALPGYRSDVIHLGARHAMENPDIGTIVLRRIAGVEGLTISATSRLAPKDAQKAMQKAHNDIKKQKWDDAQKELEKAVTIYPKYAEAWYALGTAQQEHKDLDAARKSYASALESDPKFVSPYLQLAVLAAREQKWEEVADDTDRLLRLNPVDFPQAYLYNALANYNLKKLDVAEKSAREGLSRDNLHHFPKMSHLLGVILAQKQDYSGSAENLRAYLKYAPTANDAETVKKQLAEVEKVLEPEAKKQ